MPSYAISTRFSGEEGEELNLQFDEIVYVLNALSLVGTLATRTTLPNIDHILYYASDTKQTFVGAAGVWQNVGPRRGSATIAAGNTSIAVTLSPAEPDANYRLSFMASADIGSIWYTSKATGGFTINIDAGGPSTRSATQAFGGAATSVAITLSPAEADTSYELLFTPDFETDRIWYTSKATGGFTINVKTLLPPTTIDALGTFGSEGAPGGGGNVAWVLHRGSSGGSGAPTGGATIDWMLTRD